SEVTSIEINSIRTSSIDVNPVTNLVYLSDYDSGNVFVVDGSDNSLVNTIKLASGLEDIKVNPVTNKIYTINSLDDSVSVIDGKTNKLMHIIDVGHIGWHGALDINQNTNTVYVTESDSGYILKVDGL